MTIALLIITDGREEYLTKCVESTYEHLHGPITERWMFDDTGNDKYRAELAARYPEFTHLSAGGRRGFGGAIRAAWSRLVVRSQARFVCHVEQDFTFNRDVLLQDLAHVLDENPHLVQLALRRQPWNDSERLAGGIVEQYPAEYVECESLHGPFLEHRLFFTTNPSLYRHTLCETSWPDGEQSEGRFTHQLLQEGSPEALSEDVRFGYWGARDSGEWVTHIGEYRAGMIY